MASQILSYRRIADPASRGNAKRAWLIWAIYVIPIVIPLAGWTGTMRHEIATDRANLQAPVILSLSAAAGPLAGMLRTDVVMTGPEAVNHWYDRSWRVRTEAPPILIMVGATLLIAWPITVLKTGTRHYPILLHMLMSAEWWAFGCVALFGC
jgi:hypothetical protein